MTKDPIEPESLENEPLAAADEAIEELLEPVESADDPHTDDEAGQDANDAAAKDDVASDSPKPAKTRKPKQPSKPDSPTIKIVDQVLMALAVLISAYVLVTSNGSYVAHPQYSISTSASAGSGWNIVVNELNEVKVDGQSIADVRAMVERLKTNGTPGSATIKAHKNALFGTSDWVATTLASRGVAVSIVSSD